MPTPLIVIAANGRINYANSAALVILPRIRIGDHFANPFRAPRFVDAVNTVIAEGQTAEVGFSLPGQDRVFEAQIARLPDGSDLGRAVQVIVRIEDRRELKRLDAMRTDFIANASHELRTPLASIIGFIETLQGHARDDPEAREQFLAIMATQAGRMQRLVEDLMSLSRIELDSAVTPDEWCDVANATLDAAAGLKPVADAAGVTLAVELDTSRRVFVTGDKDQLTQIAVNLIDNAIKYGRAHGRVRVWQAEPNEKYPGCVGISVADEGAGISRDHLHRLTERFYRVDVTQSRNVGGTGLGLAIVKHILNRHGGALQISSIPDQGSTFTFWVPERDMPEGENAQSPEIVNENNA